jgi:hypothetical protein
MTRARMKTIRPTTAQGMTSARLLIRPTHFSDRRSTGGVAIRYRSRAWSVSVSCGARAAAIKVG